MLSKVPNLSLTISNKLMASDLLKGRLPSEDIQSSLPHNLYLARCRTLLSRWGHISLLSVLSLFELRCSHHDIYIHTFVHSLLIYDLLLIPKNNHIHA
jgi:hypothetical protein